MAWTAPMTAIAASVFTAAQFNTFVRDNLNETAPAKAATPGAFFVTSATNQIREHSATGATVNTTETTTSTTYADLATIGPAVTVNCEAMALVCFNSNQVNSSGSAAWVTYEVSGATTSAATDARAVQLQGTGGQHAGSAILHTGLSSGSNTFTLKYRVSTSGTGTFSDRRIAVIPF